MCFLNDNVNNQPYAMYDCLTKLKVSSTLPVSELCKRFEGSQTCPDESENTTNSTNLVR